MSPTLNQSQMNNGDRERNEEKTLQKLLAYLCYQISVNDEFFQTSQTT